MSPSAAAELEQAALDVHLDRARADEQGLADLPGETRIAGLAAVAVADVSAVIAAALGIGYEAADLATAARVALAGRNMLLIADDCDHVVTAAAEQLTALVRAVPGLRVVATTRQPLGVSEERVLAVPPLACPVGSGTGAVRESAAGRLFLDRARAASPQFHLGVLDALGRLEAPAVPADLAKNLQAPAFNSYVEEGRVGGINLIIALYPAA